MKNFFKLLRLKLLCFFDRCEKHQVGTMTLKNKEGSLHELTVRMCPFCETKHYFLVPCTLNGEFKKIPKEKADMFI